MHLTHSCLYITHGICMCTQTHKPCLHACVGHRLISDILLDCFQCWDYNCAPPCPSFYTGTGDSNSGPDSLLARHVPRAICSLSLTSHPLSASSFFTSFFSPGTVLYFIFIFYCLLKQGLTEPRMTLSFRRGWP